MPLKLFPIVTPKVEQKPLRWLVETNSTKLGRDIVTRAMVDVGLMEQMKNGRGINRGVSIDRWLRAAGVPESLIKTGKGYWCAAWVGAVWRDCKCRVPVGYASCDTWIPYMVDKPIVGAVILYGVKKRNSIGQVVSRDAHHMGIVARISPLVVTIEGNRGYAGTTNDGVCVDINPPARADILGYIHPKQQQ